jgi:NTE family protein
VVWQPAWGLYRGKSKAGIVVDGGVLSNFPIHLIDVQPASDAEIAALMGNTDAAAAENLGLLIDETLPVTGAANTEKTPLLINHARTVQRLARLVDTMMGAKDNDEIRAHESEICRLPAKGYGTTEFDMPQERLDALVEAGRSAMRDHLAGRNLSTQSSAANRNERTSSRRTEYCLLELADSISALPLTVKGSARYSLPQTF